MSTLERFLAAFNKGVDWFRDDRNRDEAINILGRHRQSEARRGGKELRLFPQGRILRTDRKRFESQAACGTNVLESLGDLPSNINIDQLLLPGVTKVTD